MTAAVLSASGLRKRYGTTEALRGVDLEVRADADPGLWLWVVVYLAAVTAAAVAAFRRADL